MLGVVNHLAADRLQEGDRLADHGEVLFQRDAEHLGHVEVVRLADDRDHGGLRLDQGLHAGVVGRLNSLATGHAEGTNPAVLKGLGGDPLEKLGVLGVREGIAALDEIEAQLVEPAGDEQLVLQREIDAFALGPVAERGVVELDPGHAGLGKQFMVIYSTVLGKTLAWRARFRFSRASVKLGCCWRTLSNSAAASGNRPAANSTTPRLLRSL